MFNLTYVGEFDFNRKTASTERIINNCKAIKASNNFKVNIIGYSDVPSFIVDKLPIFNVKRGKHKASKLFYYLLRSFYIIRLLNKTNKEHDIIIYYGTSARILFPLLVYCKINKTRLIADIVEWYDYSHLPLGKYGPIALENHLCLTKLVPKCDGVIAISSYLEKYFSNRSVKTMRVPILVDTRHECKETTETHKFNQKYLNLIYAGYPGKKDLVANIISAVEQLNCDHMLINLHLLGLTGIQVQDLIHNTISDAIICYGKVSQNDVPKYLKQADFSILLRPDKRYAHAGFPTKFVESLNAGLPVIANYTSDLALYLIDGYNGFVVEDFSTEALISKMKSILSIEKVKFSQLKVNAYCTAVENFDYRLYTNNLGNFITQIQKM